MPLLNQLRWIWQQCLPSPCLWCQLPVDHHQQLLCPYCQQALPQLPYELCHYNLLWLPAVRAGLTDTAFERLLSVGWYHLPLQHWIRRWKFHGDHFAGELLQQLFIALLQQYQQRQLPLPDAIMYVPMTPKKQRKRGFNQAQLLAECAATFLQLPLLHELKRNKDSPSQVGLNRQQRQQNLAGVYSLSKPSVLPKHIAIVDDVVTTGTTANQLARLLKQQGVTALSLWTLAITPQADHSSG
ncbi:ComF family protein [Alishewanella tabrizica]|uniref:Phosphoribosyltransferase n=1 Tax=Alishewanella tabrizica TaxID=671278 RepID=A0ABQ2WSZ6_9ALTE|nr:ComF family protein [Alishewanella tabrizica]GGW68762.1 phosphoribosyltransferase [Alishewanella tabrizica]